jgi:hypothetical protein
MTHENNCKHSRLGVTIRRSPSRPGSPVDGGQAGPEPGKRSCEGAGGPVESEGQVELASGKGSFPGAGF